MKIRRFKWSILLSFVLVFLSQVTAQEETSITSDIKVLIVDGFSNHSVEKTTQKIEDILASDPTFVLQQINLLFFVL
ncbi:hypothetical protein ACFL6U_13205 [Planctomycetota bacterium]